MTRRRLLLGALLLSLLVVAAAAWTGWRVLQARDHLQVARNQLQVAKSALLDRDLPKAQEAVDQAGRETRRARGLTHDPVTAALALLPYAGNSLDVVRTVTTAADKLARQVLPDALAAATALDPQQLRRPDGSVDLTLLATAQAPLQKASTQVQQLNSEVQDLATTAVISKVAGPAQDFAEQLAELTETVVDAERAVRIAPTLLGQDRTRRWFVMVQQTSESRGTGGLIGGFAILEARNGTLKVTQQGSNADLKAEEVLPQGLPADYVDRYALEGAFDLWLNINLSPDLPVVSRYLAQRLKAQGGPQVDGVIAVDAKALALLLQGGPPVPVAPGKTVAPEGLEDYLALGQYADAGDDQARRKDKLVEVARTVTDRLTTGGGDSTALLKGISAALRSGHVRIASDDPRLAPTLRDTGVDGALPRDDRPFVYPVLNNGSGSKLDYFLDRTVRYEGGSCAGGFRRTKVTVALTSRAPALAQIPRYVTIRLDEGTPSQSLLDRLALSVYATRGAQLERATLNGQEVSERTQTLSYAVEAGLPVWQATVEVSPSQPQTLVLELIEPTRPGQPRVLEQPLARDQQATSTLPAC